MDTIHFCVPCLMRNGTSTASPDAQQNSTVDPIVHVARREKMGASKNSFTSLINEGILNMNVRIFEVNKHSRALVRLISHDMLWTMRCSTPTIVLYTMLGTFGDMDFLGYFSDKT